MDVPDHWDVSSVRSDDTKLRYYRVGNGPPLVVCHGFYESARCREPLIETLRHEFDVVAYDARGHGRSGAPDDGYSIEGRVSDLISVVTELSLAEPVLFGHSMGAVTVAWTAARHPDLPRGVVLEDPVGMTESEAADIGPDERAAVVEEKLAEVAEQTVEEIAADHADYDPSVARRIGIANKQCNPQVAEIAREGTPPLTDALDRIECPTLILKSDVHPESRAKELNIAAKLGSARLVHIPDAGHAVFRDQFDAAYSELRTFLHQV